MLSRLVAPILLISDASAWLHGLLPSYWPIRSKEIQCAKFRSLAAKQNSMLSTSRAWWCSLTKWCHGMSNNYLYYSCGLCTVSHSPSQAHTHSLFYNTSDVYCGLESWVPGLSYPVYKHTWSVWPGEEGQLVTPPFEVEKSYAASPV